MNRPHKPTFLIELQDAGTTDSTAAAIRLRQTTKTIARENQK